MAGSGGPAQRVELIRRYTGVSLWAAVAICGLYPLGDLPSAAAGGVALLGAGLAAVITSTVVHVLAVRRVPGLRGDRGRPASALAPVCVVTAMAGAGLAGAIAPLVPWPVIWGLPAGAALAAFLMLQTEPGEVPSRWDAVVALAVPIISAAAVTTRVLADGDRLGAALATAGLVAGAVVAVVVVQLGQLWLWQVAVDLDRARRAEARLAVEAERLRFAAQLHDIQGSHLQAIVVTAELAERLLDRDVEATRTQLNRIRQTAVGALDDSRAVVHGYRTFDLEVELRNAVALLEATGVRVAVRQDGGAVPPDLGETFGRLLREAVTNILRHSRTQEVTIELSAADPARLVVRDAGPRAIPGVGSGAPSAATSAASSAALSTPGTGLAALREHFHALRGRLVAEPVGDGFVVDGSVPLGAGGGSR